MLRQRLDFAHPQPAVKLSGNLGGALVLAASVLLAAGLVAHQRDLAEELDSVETKIGRLARAQSPRLAVQGSRQTVAEEVRRVNQAAMRLTIPWEELFQTVEAAADKRVALLALQPNFQKRELKISGEADDFGVIRRYVERLESGEALAEVRLVSHEVVSRPGATRIRFELTAAWRLRT